MQKEKLKLHDYQIQLINEVVKKPRLGLFLEMGLGKTIVTLSAITSLIQSGKVKKVLLIAPPSLIENTWFNEIKKWDEFSSLQFFHFTTLKSFRQANESVNIYIITPYFLRYLSSYPNLVDEFNMLIIDESSVYKNYNSVGFKNLKKILNKFERRLLLTGTPISNGYMDLWAQVYILDNGERLGHCITAYRNRYFRLLNNFFKYELIPGADSQIKEVIKDITVSLSKQDIYNTYYKDKPSDESVETASMSSVNFKKIIKYIPLTEYQMGFYNKFKRQLYYDLCGAYIYESNIEIKCKTAADLTNKLLQYSSGSLYTEDGGYVDCHNRKIEGLREIIHLHSNDNILVIYNFKHEGNKIKNAFPNAVELTKDNITKWNKNEIKLAYFQVQTLSRGVNLQFGGHIMVWFGFTWSLELYQQANARLYRQGQEYDVYCYHLCCTPIEKRLLEALSKKNATQQDLLNCLKILNEEREIDSTRDSKVS